VATVAGSAGFTRVTPEKQVTTIGKTTNRYISLARFRLALLISDQVFPSALLRKNQASDIQCLPIFGVDLQPLVQVGQPSVPQRAGIFA
jgi:hypothetical protein